MLQCDQWGVNSFGIGLEMKTANVQIQEIWTVECPECDAEQPAEFNEMSPGSPMEMSCEQCGKTFILTFERH